MNKLVATAAFAVLLALPGVVAAEGIDTSPIPTKSTWIAQSLDALLSSGWEITGTTMSDGVFYTLRNGNKWAVCSVTQHRPPGGSAGLASRCWALN